MTATAGSTFSCPTTSISIWQNSQARREPVLRVEGSIRDVRTARPARLATTRSIATTATGRSRDVSATAGSSKPGGRYGLGVVAADFDNDGWPDIYVACDMTPSLLFHNRHDGTFEERGGRSRRRLQLRRAASGRHGRCRRRLQWRRASRHREDEFFRRPAVALPERRRQVFHRRFAPQSGLSAHHLLGWGIAFIDLDGDGWKDLIIANGHVYPEVDRAAVGDRYLQKTLVYRNLGNGKFADISDQAGPALEVPRPARGLAVGDLDGDGRPEVVIVNMNAAPSLLKNQGAQQNYLAISLVGTKSNRSAIGSRVTVDAGGHVQTDEVMSGGSYYSQNDMTLYFGLGQSDSVKRIEVRWPNGGTQEWKDVAANRKIALTEGSAKLK